jgi:hypothetical protein
MCLFYIIAHRQSSESLDACIPHALERRVSLRYTSSRSELSFQNRFGSGVGRTVRDGLSARKKHGELMRRAGFC